MRLCLGSFFLFTFIRLPARSRYNPSAEKGIEEIRNIAEDQPEQVYRVFAVMTAYFKRCCCDESQITSGRA